MAQVSDWHKLYGEGWTGLITPEAFGHPAKYSRALIRHIYQHLIDEGWLEPGATVIDPFAGVGLGALHAMKHGLNWVGVELEQKFVDLGQQNIDLWNSRFSQLPNWGRAVILQGDSRKLVEVIKAGVCGLEVDTRPEMCYNSGGGDKNGQTTASGRNLETVRSRKALSGSNSGPARLHQVRSRQQTEESWLQTEESLRGTQASLPDGAAHTDIGFRARSLALERWQVTPRVSREGQEGKVRILRGKAESLHSSQRFRPLQQQSGKPASSLCELPYQPTQTSVLGCSEGGQGATEVKWPSRLGEVNGQLAALPEGEFEAVVSSPPFLGVQGTASGDLEARKGRTDTTGTYGDESDGQLATLPEGEFEACVSSPPWHGTTPESGDPNYAHKFHGDQSQYADSTLSLHNELVYMSPEWIERRKQEAKQQKNISRLPAEAKDPDYPTFWSAARQIVQQVYQLLAPGSPAVWVVKAFVRKGKRVDFPGQWQQLCESVGFETVHIHRAWLVEDRGSQFDLFGELHEKKVERKSFFRRLAERKGSPRIDFEVVLCQRKP